jgi:hypothetical protein
MPFLNKDMGAKLYFNCTNPFNAMGQAQYEAGGFLRQQPGISLI